MVQIFRGKNAKDTETAAETIISNINLINGIIYNTGKNSSLSVTSQQLKEENFDTSLEKRNRGTNT